MVMGVPERLDPPISIGDMTLVATLGEGGMATVYLGGVGEGALARPAAIKLLRPDLADADYRTRFLDEAKVVVHLHHNNVVDVHRAGEHDGQLYIAMECVNGRDLADIWDRCAELGKAFPVALAVHIIREVLRGLHYAHSLPGLSLVHRDVSPSNVLIDWAGAVRLADFGLATSTLKASMTVPGIVFGKVGYMAPEQALRQPLDGRSDVYACGAVLWELLTGRSMRDPSERDTTKAATFEAIPPSRTSRRVDPMLDGIVMKALALNRNERYATAKAMLEDLGAWIVRHAPGTGQEVLAEFMRQLFGDAGERERLARERLFAGLRNSGPHRTQLLYPGRVDTDELVEREHKQAAGEIGVRPTTPDPPEPAVPKPVEEKVKVKGEEYIPAGTVIADRYRVLSQLGRGGMGTVFLGEHTTVGRSVAIKVLTHQWSRNEAVAQRFRAEARAASAAGHPNIVEVFDAGELPDGRLYIVMEFLTGRNLFEEVEANGPMDVARACRVMRDVARAIRAAHEVGIIHRDLKPDNVMLADRGEDEGAEFVKVLDFGISANTEDQEGEKRLTMPGSAIGTPEYMAPEQCKGRPATELFDIYALGVIFFEVLTGEPPILADSFVELMARKTTEASPSVGSKRHDLSPPLVKLVDDCLALEPEARPASVREFLARLDEILRALPRSGAVAAAHAVKVAAATPDPAAVEEANQEARAARFGVGAWAVFGLAAAVVLGVGAWAALGRGSDSGVTETDNPSEAAAMVPASGADGRPNTELGDANTRPVPEVDDTAGDPEGPEAVGPDGEGDGETDDAATTRAGGEDPNPAGTARGGDGDHGDGGESASSTPKWATDVCKMKRNQAAEARSHGNWVRLKQKLDRGCYQKRDEYLELRVKALAETGDLERCVKEGKASGSASVKRQVGICQGKLGKG